MTADERETVRAHARRFPARAAARMDRLPSPPSRRGGGELIRGGSAEARRVYPQLHWSDNDSSKPPVNWKKLPLDILVVDKEKKAESFFVDDGAYAKTTRAYTLLSSSCIVCDASYSIVCVFVTEAAVPSLRRLQRDARAALEEARRDLKPRHSFAVGGDYTRDPDMKEKRARVMQERMKGTIWNDGLQTYTSATPGWGGMYFTHYFRRQPGSSVVRFALPYVSMYDTERLVVPAIADKRLELAKEAGVPSAFKGMPLEWMPATQVGISHDFSVKTHADSCIAGVTESIFWANRALKSLRFAVTSCRVHFDIGKRPCMLFMKGNEMHGTVPGGKGSCGLVLISKRNTLQQFEPGAYTDLTSAR